MKLYCRLCGYCIEYENGRGWFPGYAHKLRQHILDNHIRISEREKRDEDGTLVEIEYSALLKVEYSVHEPPAWTEYYMVETGPENGSQRP